MIVLHKLNGDEIVLNAAQIELVEKKPDTTITLMNEKKYIVKEKTDEVIERAVEYFKKIYSGNRFSS
ncbi:MAG: flagellar FlbD family protein [Spirochaetes bacterium]|nr:flagellar FlbD family protein [Spirochaetota bacterium]